MGKPISGYHDRLYIRVKDPTRFINPAYATKHHFDLTKIDINKIANFHGYYDYTGEWVNVAYDISTEQFYSFCLEMLIVRGTDVYTVIDDAGVVSFPRCPYDHRIPGSYQIFTLARKYARINIKDDYLKTINPIQRIIPSPIYFDPSSYEGLIITAGTWSEIYVCTYQSEYTGPMSDEDLDLPSIKYGCFRHIVDLLPYLNEKHLIKLRNYFIDLEKGPDSIKRGKKPYPKE